VFGGGVAGAGDAGAIAPGAFEVEGACSPVPPVGAVVDETAAEGLVVVEAVVGVPFSLPEQPANDKATTTTATLTILIESSLLSRRQVRRQRPLYGCERT